MHIKNIQQQRASKHFKNNFGIRNQARRCSCACCSCYNFPALVTTCNGLDTHTYTAHTPRHWIACSALRSRCRKNCVNRKMKVKLKMKLKKTSGLRYNASTHTHTYISIGNAYISTYYALCLPFS